MRWLRWEDDRLRGRHEAAVRDYHRLRLDGAAGREVELAAWEAGQWLNYWQTHRRLMAWAGGWLKARAAKAAAELAGE